jgi:hypothetical protein
MEVLQRTANRGSISTGFDIDNSLKFEADNTEYMSRIMTSTGNRKTFTVSVWLKRTQVSDTGDVYGHTFFQGGNAGTGTSVLFRFGTSTNTDQLRLQFVSDTQVSVTNRVFRDTSAWYHIVVAVDTTQATASDRWKLYVNGVQETSFASSYYPTQNADTQNNYSVSSTYQQDIGAYVSGGTVFGKFNGYMAEYNHIDGQQLLPTDFGEFDEDTGIWKPTAFQGSYGTNGFYLDFESSGSLGADSSGNGNNFTLNNITSADQATDTPTNNFCTINTLQPYLSTTVITNGATKMGKTAATWQTAFATIGITSGKWYWEYKTSEADNMTGIADIDTFSSFGTSAFLGQTATSWAYYAFNGKYINNSIETTYGNTFNSTNIIGVALDMDNNKLYFAKDNTWQNSGDPTSGATGTGAISITSGIYYTPSASIFDNGDEQEFNFGGYTTISIASAASDANGYGNFEYAPPTGYYALCSKNLAEFG